LLLGAQAGSRSARVSHDAATTKVHQVNGLSETIRLRGLAAPLA
jgi:hypothetical protein